MRTGNENETKFQLNYWQLPPQTLFLPTASVCVTVYLTCGPGCLTCGPGYLTCGPGYLTCGPGYYTLLLTVNSNYIVVMCATRGPQERGPGGPKHFCTLPGVLKYVPIGVLKYVPIRVLKYVPRGPKHFCTFLGGPKVNTSTALIPSFVCLQQSDVMTLSMVTCRYPIRPNMVVSHVGWCLRILVHHWYSVNV